MKLRQHHPSLGELGEVLKKNMKLVYKCAHSISRKSDVDMEELISEGIIGLMIAFDRYDPQRGSAFSTFATPYIRGYMLTFMRSIGQTIRIPTHIFETALTINKRSLHDEPPEVIAKKIGRPEKYVIEALLYLNDGSKCYSLEKKLDDDIEFGNRLGRMTDYSTAVVNDFYSYLDEKERAVIEMRASGYQTKEIYERLGLSHEAIRGRLLKVRAKADRYFSGQKIAVR